jgi:putative exosortase-associated protein (TIGR04073 family)
MLHHRKLGIQISPCIILSKKSTDELEFLNEREDIKNSGYRLILKKYFLTIIILSGKLYKKEVDMRLFLVLVVIGSLFLSCIAPVFANEPKDKLARGVANVFSAVVEIPQNIDMEWKESKNAVTGIFAGFFKGLGWGAARCISGLWDIVSFPFPKPDGYNSLVQPEYIKRGVQTHFMGQQK